jgi:peptide/nickel transport system permease protein
MDAETGSLTSYAGRRALVAIPLLVGVLLVTFVLVHMAPGDPVSILAGEHTTLEHQAFIREQLGLDRPLWERFWFYATRVVQGDLGYSYASGRPVVTEIGERIPPTVFLILSALVFSAGGGLLLGVLTCRRPATPVDFAISASCLVLHSIPVF